MSNVDNGFSCVWKKKHQTISQIFHIYDIIMKKAKKKANEIFFILQNKRKTKNKKILTNFPF